MSDFSSMSYDFMPYNLPPIPSNTSGGNSSNSLNQQKFENTSKQQVQIKDGFTPSLQAQNNSTILLSNGDAINAQTGELIKSVGMDAMSITDEDIIIEADILRQKGNLSPVEQAWIDYADAKLSSSYI